MNIFYKNKFVNDLAWVIYSNSLINKAEFTSIYSSKECLDLYLMHQNWFVNIDENLDNYKEDIFIKNHLLGKYFEQLLGFFFKHSPYYDIILQNEQIIINKETKGEIDFIVYNKILKQYEHIEVAIKYYMKTKEHDKSQWVGPNSNDYFEKKTNNLFNHQAKILSLYKSELPELDKIKSIKSRIFLKGYLLEKNEHSNFIYLQEGDLEEYKKNILSYYEIKKLDWLCPTYYKPENVHFKNDIINWNASIKERFITNPRRPITFNVLLKNKMLQTIIILNNNWPKN